MPTNKTIKRKYPQEMSLMDDCPNCGQEVNKKFVEGVIDDILLTQLQEIEEMVEGMKKEWREWDKSHTPAFKKHEIDGRNQALSDLLQALKEKKEELTANK